MEIIRNSINDIHKDQDVSFLGMKIKCGNDMTAALNSVHYPQKKHRSAEI